MKSVIEIGKLINILKENRDKHRSIFIRAIDGYKKEAIKLLEEQLDRIKNNDKFIKVYVNLPVPEDHTDDYNRIIRLLQLDNSETIELDEIEFSQYVMDDWGWKNAWASTTLSYIE